MRRQRRQNTRLNLGRDPLGAGVAYSQSGFNDLGGLLSQKIQEGTAKVASFEKQRRDKLKLEEEKAGLMVEGFMANQAEGIDLTAIPDEDKGMITEFSMNQKQIYADAAQAAGSMKAGSPEKLEQIAIMKKANQRLQNVEKQYNAWGGMREDYIQDFQSKNLSVANSSGNMISAAGIFTGAQQRSFDEDGNIMFTDGSGNVTRMSDIKQPFEKAYKEAKSINETMLKIYSKGQKLDDTEKTYLRNSLSDLIDNAGIEGLQSLSFDKLVGKEAFFNEEERYLIESLDTNNPEELIQAKKDLKELLLDKMINVADQQAISGFNKAEAAKLPKQKKKTAVELFRAKSDLFSSELLTNKDNQAILDDNISKTLSDKLTMQITRNYGYHVYYDNENKQFVLFKPDQEESFEEGRKYSNNTAGIAKMLKEIDLSLIN
jgi:hypothetical protein